MYSMYAEHMAQYSIRAAKDTQQLTRDDYMKAMLADRPFYRAYLKST